MKQLDLRSYKTVKDRRDAVSQSTGVPLASIGNFVLDEQVASHRHCENMIGATQVPLGLAGPLIIEGIGEVLVPLATTEGALIASVSRGAKAITQSGGAQSSAVRKGTTRGLVFGVQDIAHGKKFSAFIQDHRTQLSDKAKETSSHIEVIDVTVKTVGKFAFVRIAFDTQDAMGMNMVTIASDVIGQYVASQTKTKLISVAGNFDVDKKPAWLNVILGRGWEVTAECVITKEILANVLKTDAQAIYDVWLAKCMIGSAVSGSMAFNAHFANIVAAIFLATGQDSAHVVEGSLGITTTEALANGDLYISVSLPDILVGTVGGGTGLATQKEALALMGVAGGDQGKNAQQFATIVGATVLAGELSLLASLSQGTLAHAHQRLARGKT